MSRRKSFYTITVADFLVRSAYQMGKTPLLPLFAASLGATDAFLGIIVSVSTLTGMLLKPVIGFLSDRWGRRNWLIAGTLFFAFMPFTYRFVGTPEMLFVIRFIHGLATAIYGPVTLAYVAEQSPGRRGERLGWFGLARSAGYIVGPAATGWMLLSMSPVAIFTVIGFLSCAAFIPILTLPESGAVKPVNRPPLLLQARLSLRASSHAPAVWLSGGLEAVSFVALYATKAFLPIHAVAMGTNIAVVGFFFALQEAIYMVLRPAGGRFGDRRGYLLAIGLGMLSLGGVALPIGWVTDDSKLLLMAAVMGVAQSLIFPSTTALVSTQMNESNLGAGMGFVGAFSNAGKVVGPVLGGLLIGGLNYSLTFQLLGGLLVLGGVAIGAAHLLRPRFRRRPKGEVLPL